MSKLSTIAIALALVLGTGCKKKDEAATPAADKAPADPKVTEPAGPAAKADPKVEAAPTTPAPTTPAPTTPGQGLKLAWKTAAVGSHETVTDEMKTAFTLSPPGGKPVDMVMFKKRTYDVEILEAGDAVTKVKVRYEVAADGGTMGGEPKDETQAVQGKTYVVWADGGVIKATAEDGKDVTAEELEELVDEFDDEIGKVPGMPKVIAKYAWKPGEQVTLSPEDLAMLDVGDKGMVAQSALVTLTAADAAVATFALDIVMLKKDEGGEMKIPMKMTAKIDVATLHARELTMHGILDGTVEGMGMKGTLDGIKTSTMK